MRIASKRVAFVTVMAMILAFMLNIFFAAIPVSAYAEGEEGQEVTYVEPAAGGDTSGSEATVTETPAAVTETPAAAETNTEETTAPESTEETETSVETAPTVQEPVTTTEEETPMTKSRCFLEHKAHLTLINVVEQTAETEGYTGDYYCTVCQWICKKGNVIAVDGTVVENTDAETETEAEASEDAEESAEEAATEEAAESEATGDVQFENAVLVSGKVTVSGEVPVGSHLVVTDESAKYSGDGVVAYDISVVYQNTTGEWVKYEPYDFNKYLDVSIVLPTAEATEEATESNEAEATAEPEGTEAVENAETVTAEAVATPDGPVAQTVELEDAPSIIHITDSGETVEVEDATYDPTTNTISFRTDGFSVYAYANKDGKLLTVDDKEIELAKVKNISINKVYARTPDRVEVSLVLEDGDGYDVISAYVDFNSNGGGRLGTYLTKEYKLDNGTSFWYGTINVSPYQAQVDYTLSRIFVTAKNVTTGESYTESFWNASTDEIEKIAKDGDPGITYYTQMDSKFRTISFGVKDVGCPPCVFTPYFKFINSEKKEATYYYDIINGDVTITLKDDTKQVIGDKWQLYSLRDRGVTRVILKTTDGEKYYYSISDLLNEISDATQYTIKILDDNKFELWILSEQVKNFEFTQIKPTTTTSTTK